MITLASPISALYARRELALMRTRTASALREAWRARVAVVGAVGAARDPAEATAPRSDQ